MKIFFNEPFSYFHDMAELKNELHNHNFTIEDLSFSNNFANDKLYKFNHLNLVKVNKFNLFTTKLRK